MFRKSILAVSLLLTFSVGAHAAENDLLAFATDNAVNGTAFELSKEESQKVYGGSYQFLWNNYYSFAKESVGNITEKYYGDLARLYARRTYSGGSDQFWLNFSSNNGQTWRQAWGTEAVRLINLYKYRAASYL